MADDAAVEWKGCPEISEAAVGVFLNTFDRQWAPGTGLEERTRAGLAAAYPYLIGQRCQDNGLKVVPGLGSSCLHECVRPLAHRSRVHRCRCGCEWAYSPGAAPAGQSAPEAVS